MPGKKHTSFERVLGRLETLDAASLAAVAQRLARERKLFEEIFNGLQEGILVIAGDGAIDYANASARRLLGLDEAGSQNLWRVVPGLRASLGPALAGSARGSASPQVVARELELNYPEPRTLRFYLV
ncbi:MAG TPA: PAS domain-containing protein, partial [Opitutaceae bacterium]|nr:PAS domain-containing protein [Opitutaceae bacterium]